MPTKSRPFVKAAVAFALLAGGAIMANRASSSPAPMEPEFRATYPRTPVSGSQLAGIELDKLVLPGLKLVEREDRTVDDVGIVLSFADSNDQVRVVVSVAVAANEEAARKFVDVTLHGVQVTMPRAVDPAMGDYAFADDAGKGEALVVASAGNVAWSARVDRDAPAMPRASDVISTLRSLAVAGAPSFPTVTLSLPTEVRMGGAPITIAVPSGLTPKLRAEGAYVAHGKGSPLVRPFAPGPIAVAATVTDSLGRVGFVRVTSTAR
jgi:hypothetical protein